jgi:hypothetical protein
MLFGSTQAQAIPHIWTASKRTLGPSASPMPSWSSDAYDEFSVKQLISEEDAMWRDIVKRMIDRGASHVEAVEAANLVIAARRREASSSSTPLAFEDGKRSGVRRRRNTTQSG